jgi:hypothetical protein
MNFHHKRKCISNILNFILYEINSHIYICTCRHIKYEIKNVANAFPLMMKIHVIGLNPKYLDVYRTQFPSSVVSTICAVSIKEVSSHENECEVLLRGPFFQVLQIYDSKKKRGIKRRLRILEMVMLNTNRDHISTMQLSKSDRRKKKQIERVILISCTVLLLLHYYKMLAFINFYFKDNTKYNICLLCIVS